MTSSRMHRRRASRISGGRKLRGLERRVAELERLAMSGELPSQDAVAEMLLSPTEAGPSELQEASPVIEQQPSAEPEARPEPVQFPYRRADVTETAKGKVGVFLSEEEYRGSAPVEQSVDTGPKESWEVRLAISWLPKIGGVLLLIGAAIAGTLVVPRMGPEAKVAIGYLLSAVIVAAGFFATRRHQLLGRMTAAIGASLAYFVSFATYYVDPSRIFASAYPSLLLMALSVVGIVVLAERWRSQAVAGMAFLLGVVAVLISARTSQEFALVGLMLLSVGGGAVLLRHQWKELTAFSLIGIYTATFILWVVEPVGAARGTIMAHLGALVFYHIVFTLAFWRWGRVWVAREMAAASMTEHDAAPRLQVGMLPYSTSMAIVNSIGLSALSIWLIWETGTLWHQVEFLLFGLAGVEAVRVLVPSLRRGGLMQFHILSASALVCGGVVAAFDGPARSAAIAAEVLILAIAGSRTRPLAFLRPLTILPALLVPVFIIVDLFNIWPVGSVADMLLWTLPGLLLLASTLPWETIWTGRRENFAGPVWVWLERLSGQGRAAIAAVVVLTAFLSYTPMEEYPRTVFAGLAIVFVAGMVILRAWSWFFACIGTSAAALFLIAIYHDMERLDGPWSLWEIAGAMAFLVALFYLWQEAGKAMRTGGGRIAVLVATWLFLSPIAAAVLVGMSNTDLPLHGLFMGGAMVVLGFVQWFGLRTPALPRALPDLPLDAYGPFMDSPREPAWVRGAFAINPAVVVGIPIALVLAVFMDAEESLLSPLVLGAVLMSFWMSVKDGGAGRRLLRHGAFVTALGVLCVSSLVYSDLSQAGILRAGVFACVLLLLGSWRKEPVPALASGIILPLLATLAAIRGLEPGTIGNAEGGFGLGLGALLLGAGLWVRQMVTSDVSRPEKVNLSLAQLLYVSSAFIFLIYLSNGSLIPEQLMTPLWGVTGIVFLVLGFLFIDSTLRYVSLAIFAAAILRIVFYELTGTSALTKALAMLGIGFLMVVAALVYGFLRWRLAAMVEDKKPPLPEESGGKPES